MDTDDVPEHYICGTMKMKGTIYGPEEFVPENLKRFRCMNYQEYQYYMNKVEESGGFDVDGCTGALAGRISPVSPTCRFWDQAVLAAKHAALRQAEQGGKTIEFVRLIKANAGAVAGILYYLTFTAIDTTEQKEKIYKAKVWGQPVGGLELLYFEDDLGAKEFDVGQYDDVGDNASEKVDAAKSDNVHHGVRTITPTRGELLRDSFFLVCEEIRKQNPQWKQVKVEKAASEKWESLTFRLKERSQFEQENNMSTAGSPTLGYYLLQVKANTTDCTYHIEGERFVDLDWIELGVIDEKVGNQGVRDSCWAWVSTKLAEAENRNASRPVPPLSVQDVMNNADPPKDGCKGGLTVVATEQDCPYQAKVPPVKPPRPQEKYFIDDWKLIADKEIAMDDALKERPLAVTIPLVSAVVGYRGGLLDLCLAEDNHVKTRYPEIFQQSSDLEGHSVLLVGKGHIVPHGWPYIDIDFWIIKNQWKDSWGNKGLADIICNSSIMKLKKLVLNHADADASVWHYSPLAAIINSQQVANIPVNMVHLNLPAHQLLNDVETDNKRSYILLFYSQQHLQHHPTLLENFRRISSVYEHELNVVFARVNVETDPDATNFYQLA